MKKIVIAIDGHSSCGKSTMAKDLARSIGYVYVDTGAMYRAVTLYAMRKGLLSDGVIDEDGLRNDIQQGRVSVSFRFNQEKGRPDTYLCGELVEDEIRQMSVSNNVSPVAALPFVRTFLTEQQQAMGKDGGIVMDGRDIGTVVFPDAELKIFVTASAEVRAQRRYKELADKAKSAPGTPLPDYDDVLKNVIDRDYIDSHREVSPLRKAEDALLLDNSDMSIAEQRDWLMAQYEKVTQ